MSDPKYGSIVFHASWIVEKASAAYWDDAREAFHDKAVRESFAKLADLLGCTVTPKEPPPASVYYDEGDLE